MGPAHSPAAAADPATATVHVPVAESGTYVVIARSFSQRAAGNYVLDIRRSGPPR